MKTLFENFSRNRWFPCICIATLGFIVYQKSLFFGYTYMDDHILILQNYDFLKDMTNFFHAFGRDVFYPMKNPLVFFRPMLTFSFMFDAHLTGLAPAGYHLTNIVIHIAASCLLFLFLTRLGYGRTASFLMACVFVVHPVLSQAVAWIPGRNDSLLAVFVLASFIAFIDFVKTERRTYYFWHLAFSILALFTKESGLAIMPLCLFYYYVVLREKGLPRKMAAFLFGWFFIAAVWFYLRHPVVKGAVPWTILDASRSLSILVPGLIQYIGKIILPVNLSVTPIMRDISIWYGCVAIILVAAIVLFSRNRRAAFMAFGATWFVIFLIPSSIGPNLGVLISDFMEHRIYVPMIGFAIILLESDFMKLLDLKKRSASIIAALIIIAFAGITYAHLGSFRDMISFWEDAARTSPHSASAHHNLGVFYYDKGMIDKAEAEFKTALSLNPEEPIVHAKLGQIYFLRGGFADAEREFKEEIERNPLYPESYVSLGVLYYKQGRPKEAEGLWKKALQIDPGNIGAHKNLAIYYCENKDAPRALYHVEALRKRGVDIPQDFLDKLRSIK